MAPKLIFLLLFTLFSTSCFCFKVKSLNQTRNAFQTAVATWYGPESGSGSVLSFNTWFDDEEGGACGLAEDVSSPPYSSMISAGNQALFQKGKGCGACYQAFCDEYPECSGTPITVTITDECPGSCNDHPVHFDFSGFAFGAMAKPGQDDALRRRGLINVQYQRVSCKYTKFNILFKVDNGSNPYFFAAAVENVNGDGTIKTLEIQPDGSDTWNEMAENFGANYKWNVPQSEIGKAYSLRITSGDDKKIESKNVIPVDWKPGQAINSHTNF